MLVAWADVRGWRTQDGWRYLRFALRSLRINRPRPAYLYEKGAPLKGSVVWL